MPGPNLAFTNPAPSSSTDCHVFLPGWGFDGRITGLTEQPQQWLSPDPRLYPAETAEALAIYLARHKVGPVIIAGWSMGAYLAIDFALRHPKEVRALYLAGLRQAWPREEIDLIRAELTEDPVTFMKRFYRKCFLGHKQSYRNFREILEESYLANLNPARLEAGLKYLQDFHLPEKAGNLARLNIPTFLLHGSRDVIAPPAEIPAIPGAICQLIDNAGHPVFLDDSCRFDHHRKKETIRLKFSRAAESYDDHAAVQKEVALQLAAILPAIPPTTILEIGCGTAYYTSLLQNRYPAAAITAIDFAEKMLAVAGKKLSNRKNISFLCADAEIFLRATTDSFDLVTANATMHWFDDLERTTALIANHLNNGGAMICSIFGPETMAEMRTGLAAVHGKEVPVPATLFPDREELQRIFRTLFQSVEIDERRIVRDYPDLADLLRNISRTGTAGWHHGQPLINRQTLGELELWFKETYGHCQITYQIFMVKCGE